MTTSQELPSGGVVHFITPVAYMPLGEPKDSGDMLVAVSLIDLIEAQKEHNEALQNAKAEERQRIKSLAVRTDQPLNPKYVFYTILETDLEALEPNEEKTP